LNVRPKRVWALCILFGFSALFNIAISTYILLSPKLAEIVYINTIHLSSMIVSSTLVITSLVCLFKRSNHSLLFVLLASGLYFGTWSAPNVIYLVSSTVSNKIQPALLGNILAQLVSMGIVLWIIFSKKTKDYLKST